MATSGQYKLDGRVEHSTRVTGDNLYLWGGNNVPLVHNNDEKRRLTSQIAIFNITSGIWNSRPTNGSPPLGVKGCLSTSTNTKMYYFGGWCHHNICFHNSLNELDISTLTWTQLQSTDDSITVMKRGYGGIMSSEQAGHHCLLIIGGGGSLPSIQLPQAQYFQYSDGIVSTNEQNIYNLKTGQWIIPEIIGQCMPPNAGFVMDAVNNTRAIIFGGFIEGIVSNTFYILDIINHTVLWQTITKPHPVQQWPDERGNHAASIITGSISPILVMIGGMDKADKTIKDCWILDINEKSWTKINLPDSVTEREGHSLSTFIMGPYCVWLIVIGGHVKFKEVAITDPNITMLFELVLNDGQWSVGFVLDSNDLTSTNKYQQRVLKRFAEVRKQWIEQSQNNSLTKKAPSYNNDVLFAKQNIKSLQERLLELESEQVQENDRYIAELQKKDEIITILQKQLEQSNEQNKTEMTTSKHHKEVKDIDSAKGTLEDQHPTEIFRTNMADLIKAITSNLDEITDRLFSKRLIGQDVLQSTTTEGVSSYRKARKVVHELFNLLQAHRDPKQYLTTLCEVLLKLDDPRLRDIANNIKTKLCL